MSFVHPKRIFRKTKFAITDWFWNYLVPDRMIVGFARAPKMTDYSVSEEDGKVYLTVNLSDDRFVHAVELYESYTGDDEEYEPYYETYVFDQGEMGSECEAVFDITGLDADHLYIDIYDEALNEKTELIELS